MSRKPKSDALQELYDELIGDDPGQQADYDEALVNVKAAQLPQGVADEPLTERFIAQIARNCHGLSAGIFDQGDHLLSVGFLGRKIIDRNISAFPRVGDCRRPSHTRIAPRYKRLSTG